MAPMFSGALLCRRLTDSPSEGMTYPPPAAAHTCLSHPLRSAATAAPKLDLRICFPLDTS